VLAPGDVARVVTAIVDRFGTRPRLPVSGALWASLRATESHQDAEAWRTIGEYSDGQPVTLLIDDLGGRRTGVFLRDSARLTALLGETEGFVFYVVPVDHSWLLAFNDHDVLLVWDASRCR